MKAEETIQSFEQSLHLPAFLICKIYFRTKGRLPKKEWHLTFPVQVNGMQRNSIPNIDLLRPSNSSKIDSWSSFTVQGCKMAQPLHPKLSWAPSSAGQDPPSKRPKVDTRPSSLLEKYTHPVTSRHVAIRNYPNKTALTPLNEGPFYTREEKDEWQALEEYQKNRFEGAAALTHVWIGSDYS